MKSTLSPHTEVPGVVVVVMSKQEIQSQIDELELELQDYEFGDYSYDVVSSELECLYLKKEEAE